MSGDILVVDDDADLRETVELLLDDSGYDVTAVANGRAALDQLKGGARPDLILLDLMMPEMNGWQFLERAQADSILDSIPVVIMTARKGADLLPAPSKQVLDHDDDHEDRHADPEHLRLHLGRIHSGPHLGRCPTLHSRPPVAGSRGDGDDPVELLRFVAARIVKRFPREISDQPEPVGIGLPAVVLCAPPDTLVGRFLPDRFEEVVDLRSPERLLAGLAETHAPPFFPALVV